MYVYVSDCVWSVDVHRLTADITVYVWHDFSMSVFGPYSGLRYFRNINLSLMDTIKALDHGTPATNKVQQDTAKESKM